MVKSQDDYDTLREAGEEIIQTNANTTDGLTW